MHVTPVAFRLHQCPLAAYLLRQAPIAGIWVFGPFVLPNGNVPVRSVHLADPRLG